MAFGEELLWRQYELQVGLYKEYLNLVLKMNGFYYVATGALISFYLSKPQTPWMKYSLAFPALVGFCLAGLFLYGSWTALVSRQELLELAGLLGFKVAPEYRILIVFLALSAVLMLVVVIGLVIIIFFPLPCAAT